jgi:hypothetical protein
MDQISTSGDRGFGLARSPFQSSGLSSCKLRHRAKRLFGPHLDESAEAADFRVAAPARHGEDRPH